jgi:hypothetical protein
MNTKQLGSRQDLKVNVKVVLSGLWVSMLFVFAYVDIFAYLRADVINGVLDGKVAGVGVDINQGILALTLLYILVPALMVTFSLIAPARFNRPINIVVSLVYALSVVAAAIGETWAYYIIGSVVEVLLLLTIATIAWFWPHSLTPNEATESPKQNAPGTDRPKSPQPSHQ